MSIIIADDSGIIDTPDQNDRQGYLGMFLEDIVETAEYNSKQK